MKRITLFTHAASALIVTGIFVAMYATVQQVHRSTANDPQMQIARDISARLDAYNIVHLLPDDTIEISNSLGTFVTFYDHNGEPIGSSGMLDGKLPKIPKGVFEYARINREHDVTWQPRPGVRMAMIVESVPSSLQVGFVAVGRSLQEVEIRESNLVRILLMIWVACMGVIVMHYLIQLWLQRKSATK
jgi:hypothetical protein